MGFSAKSVEALDYDFRPHVDAVGTIPEPSHDARDQFLKRLDEATDGEGDLEAKIADVTIEDIHKMEGLYVEALAELAQGTPTKEQLEQLPPRHQLALLGWLVGQLTDPTQRDTSR